MPLQYVEAEGQGGKRDGTEIFNLTVPSIATTTDTANTVADPNVDGVPTRLLYGAGSDGYDDPNDGPSALILTLTPTRNRTI